MSKKSKEEWAGSMMCLFCEHWHEDGTITCEAFPEGIPHVIISNEIDHFTVLKGQSNNLVYEPKKKKK